MAAPLPAPSNVVPYAELERRRRRRQSDFDLEVELVALKQRQIRYERVEQPLFYSGTAFAVAALFAVLLFSSQAAMWVFTALGFVAFGLITVVGARAQRLSDEAFRRRRQWIEEREWSEK